MIEEPQTKRRVQKYGHTFPDIFLPHSFSFAIESYTYETDFALGPIEKYRF